MAAVPVTLSVVIYPKNKTVEPYPATLVGYAWMTGLGVGGGPIVNPPVEPPIDPPPPDTPLDELLTAVAKEPPASGGWGWFPEYGWMYKPAPGAAQPKTLSGEHRK